MSPVDPFVIRQLVADDVALFRGLLATFGKVFEDDDTYVGAQPSTRYLEALLGGDQFIAIAASENNVVVGGLTAYVLQKSERERNEIYIHELAVEAERRRRGVATRLIAHLKTIAVARGASLMFVQADLEDPPAIALYTKLGARKEILHFDIKVE